MDWKRWLVGVVVVSAIGAGGYYLGGRTSGDSDNSGLPAGVFEKAPADEPDASLEELLEDFETQPAPLPLPPPDPIRPGDSLVGDDTLTKGELEDYFSDQGLDDIDGDGLDNQYDLDPLDDDLTGNWDDWDNDWP